MPDWPRCFSAHGLTISLSRALTNSRRAVFFAGILCLYGNFRAADRS